MKKLVWAIAIGFMGQALFAKSTLKEGETLTSATLADSVKKVAPRLLSKDSVKPSPVVFQPKTIPVPAVVPSPSPTPTSTTNALVPGKIKAPSTPVVSQAPVLKDSVSRPTNKDSVVAKRFRISKRPQSMEEVKYFLAAFKLKVEGKPESTSVNMTWRDKRGAILSYEVGPSEVSFANENIPMLSPKDYVPDSLIRNRTDEALKSVMKNKAEKYVFANYEITMVQKKNGDDKENVLPPVPAFYIGRYIRKLEERVILGDAFQIRMSYGEGGALQAFSYRDPVVVEAGTVKIPSREMIIDSLMRWEKSKTHGRASLYPFHPDKLKIRTLKPIKVIESYLISQEKFRDGSQPEGDYLIPLVTVLARVELAPSRKKASVPLPEDPIILHFHFPCQPSRGLCWPDGNQGIGGLTPSANPNATASPATGNSPSTQGKPEISTPK